MNLKIACKNPINCSMDCLNCPYTTNERFNDFKKLYKEVNDSYDNNRKIKM